MIRGVEHIAICAEDVPSLIAWYQRLFDLELIKEGDDGPYFLGFPGGMLIEFIEATGDLPQAPRAKQKGFRHIALSISPIEKTVESLKKEGVEVVDEFKIVPNGTKLIQFRDNDGKIIQ